MKKKTIIKSLLVAGATLLTTFTMLSVSFPTTAATETLEYNSMIGELMEEATSFVVVYHKQMGGSHYAYTEAVSDHLNDGRQWGGDSGIESNWNPKSKMTLVTLKRDGDKVIKTETALKGLNDRDGVFRDPCVSDDGTKVVFSWKKDAMDDYHLYEYTFATQETVQLTFGSGVADIEPVYTGNGNIVFNSTRDIQTVDCWHTDVSNLYVCGPDGSNITRLGYDQVHTTYPTTTSDGRILYTRWDYNDRSQMYVQALYQMFQDGTLQTEVFGNNASNPTTLLHTREIPGEAGKYVAIVTGHHTHQVGKLLTIDTNDGRNTKNALTYVWRDSATSSLQNSHDNDTGWYYDGKVFKYPIAISDDLFLVSTCDNGYTGRDTAFNIELVNSRKKNVVLVEGSADYPASQVALIKNESNPQFNRASLVNYANDYGTYYVGNVYEGDSMKGVAAGTVKYLRVVALEFRSSAIGATVGRGTGGSDPYSPIATGNGAWDVKKVVGIVDVYEDGSALFTAPSEVPLYFQLLDKDGNMIQTMRSWSTLQPGEYFSCVGCHLDKNYAPPTQSKITQAMKNGVQELRPDLWMSTSDSYDDYDPYDASTHVGFDYLDVVQPILDANCITCHSNSSTGYTKINASAMNSVDLTAADSVISKRDSWSFTTTAPTGAWTTATFDSSSWDQAFAPFGKIGTAPGKINTVWKSDSIWLRKNITLTQYDLEECNLIMNLAYTDKIEVYINGTKVYTGNAKAADYTSVALDDTARAACKVGNNTIAVKVSGSTAGQFFDLELKAGKGGGTTTNLVNLKTNWKVMISDTETITGTDWTKPGFDTASWKNASAPLGNRAGGNGASGWGKDGKNYLWAIKTFQVDDVDALKKATLYLNTFYDDDIKFYLNGNLIHQDGNWTDDYVSITLTNAAKYLVKGTNVLAVSALQHTGGYEMDVSLYATVPVAGPSSGSTGSPAQFSLEGTPVIGQRMRKYFPMSYLILTGSTVDGNKQWITTKPQNQYINFISSMSQSEILSPNRYGSAKSNLIKRLRTGHGNLTEAQIQAIAAWIDLCVPCYGSYYVRDAWDGNDVREYEEELNKRLLYDKLDEYAKRARAGLDEGTGTIKIDYTNTKKKNYTAEGEGMVILYVPNKYSGNDKLTITLPEGEKYLALSLSSRIGETIIYCPDGKFDYTFPNPNKTFPNTMNTGKDVCYRNNTITARLVTAEELAKVHNLALNPYDMTSGTNEYPHASTNNVYTNSEEWAARNAIDGFTANEGHGNYPYQSWAPNDSVKASDYFMIDFGREVTVNELVVLIRADFPHDSYFTGCTVTLSDGTTMEINLTNSELEQVIDLGGVKTTSIKLSNFTVEKTGATTGYAALTEVKCMGTEVKQ